MGFSLFLIICFVLVVIRLSLNFFSYFTCAQHASEIWDYGNKAGTHEDTTGSRADRVIDIDALLKIYGEFDGRNKKIIRDFPKVTFAKGSIRARIYICSSPFISPAISKKLKLNGFQITSKQYLNSNYNLGFESPIKITARQKKRRTSLG